MLFQLVKVAAAELLATVAVVLLDAISDIYSLEHCALRLLA